MLLLPLPFKTTPPINFKATLFPHLQAALPKNSSQIIQNSLLELDILRGTKLDYGKLASQIQLNPDLHNEIEGNAIKLLR